MAYTMLSEWLRTPTAQEASRIDISLLLIETNRTTPEYTKQNPSPESSNLSGDQKNSSPFLEYERLLQ
jgi:hypothetical protein